MKKQHRKRAPIRRKPTVAEQSARRREAQQAKVQENRDFEISMAERHALIEARKAAMPPEIRAEFDQLEAWQEEYEKLHGERDDYDHPNDMRLQEIWDTYLDPEEAEEVRRIQEKQAKAGTDDIA